jgi:hypothetical protein
MFERWRNIILPLFLLNLKLLLSYEDGRLMKLTQVCVQLRDMAIGELSLQFRLPVTIKLYCINLVLLLSRVRVVCVLETGFGLFNWIY